MSHDISPRSPGSPPPSPDGMTALRPAAPLEPITAPRSLTPTRVRYGVLAFACVLSMVTYLDRVCVASAGSRLVKTLGLASIADLNLAFTAFAFAYAAFEIPSGWL